MSMSRKDYEAIAGALRQTVERYPMASPALVEAAACIADVMKTDNPRFNRALFMALATGGDEQMVQRQIIRDALSNAAIDEMLAVGPPR